MMMVKENDDYDDSNAVDDDDAGKWERDKDHYSTYDGRATHIRWENISRGKYKTEEKSILAVQKKGRLLYCLITTHSTILGMILWAIFN